MLIPDAFVRFRRPLVLALHLVLIPVAFYAAFALRFDFSVPPENLHFFWGALPYLMVIRLAAFGVAGLYHGWWRHVGISDLMRLVYAVTASCALLPLALFMTGQLEGFPRSVLVLDWATALLVFGGVRFAVRVVREQRLPTWGEREGKRALVIGAGQAGERLLRELRRDASPTVNPVGLVDDDPEKARMRLHGIPVLGTTDQLDSLVTKAAIELVVIAIPSASRDDMRRLVDRCLQTGVDFKIVPSMREMLEGRARVNQLRDVQIEDLLGREAVDLSIDPTGGGLRGRTVLVTGGAGSIGSELARQIAVFRPARLVIMDQAESPLYFAHLELQAAHPGLPVHPVVGDITDQSRVEHVFARYRPEYVFHAAAYKHVPLMESNPVEAVRTNVFGTLCVAQAAARYGAGRFVLISTDKAVNPSSVMGATKRVAEQIVLGWPALRKSGTDFRAVRFGNVLGSDGSVIPLFKRQLAAGQPLTVTHADVTRYFMTIPEAVQLVLQAAALPEAAGRTCMLEMGEPVRIVDLAENLIRLSGLRPHVDVPIVFTGLRPGEKLHEELMSQFEATVPTEISKVRILQSSEPEPDALTGALDHLAAAAAVGERADILDALRALVPDCVPPLRRPGLHPAEAE